MPHLLSTLAIPPAPAVLDAVYVHTPILVYVRLPVLYRYGLWAGCVTGPRVL